VENGDERLQESPTHITVKLEAEAWLSSPISMAFGMGSG